MMKLLLLSKLYYFINNVYMEFVQGRCSQTGLTPLTCATMTRITLTGPHTAGRVNVNKGSKVILIITDI